jgi:hypothetical protein
MSCGPAGRPPGEYHADLAHADRGHQLLEPQAIAIGAGLTQVAVDDHDTVQRPAKGNRPLAQRVLPLGALGVLEHLAQRARADIQVCLALEVRGGALLCISRFMTLISSSGNPKPFQSAVAPPHLRDRPAVPGGVLP